MAGPDVECLDHWPVSDTVYLTLDLEQDYGTAAPGVAFESAARTDVLVDILERHDVPLTCFVQTQALETVPQAVRTLEACGVDVTFHAHTHTHPRRSEADIGTEIGESVERVRNRFDVEPVGFRFPDGTLKQADYYRLAAHDVAFDASVFPTWRPGRFNRSSVSPYPFKHSPTDVVELPFSVVTPTLRVPVSLSYLKLLGRLFEELVYRIRPPVVVFDMHMHDLIVPSMYDSLPRHYRGIYGRRKHSGVEVLDRFVDRFKSMGYRFRVIADLYEDTREAIDGETLPGTQPQADCRNRLDGEL